ncbi:MAG: SIS domain-containing protein [Anaerolineae bacterium]|nr:SIS domain-containing protein [Anaerolineae bacterium]
MENYIERYFSTAIAQLQKVLAEESDAIYKAAEAVADALANDKDFMLYGSGHSANIAGDGFWRAGGFAPAIHVKDVTGGASERVEGAAAITLSHYNLEAGSVMVVISNSGINAGPLETAMISQAAGLTVIALTSLTHSQSVPARHSSGKKLYEIADIVIDTKGIPGDAAIDLPNTDMKSGATSTVVGAAIIQAIVVQAAALLAERGIEPPVLVSANVPHGDAHNEKLRERYRPRMVRYEIGKPVSVVPKAK